MLLEWIFCPTGMLLVEVLVFLLPVVLSWHAGKRCAKRDLMWGNAAQCLLSGMLVAVLGLSDSLLNKCGNLWMPYFKPFSAVELFSCWKVCYCCFNGVLIAGGKQAANIKVNQKMNDCNTLWV